MSRKFLVPLVLPANPTAALEAAPKQYVDSHDMPVGGTTNQVLAKTSATDYATGWVTPAGSASEVEIAAADPIGSNALAELWYDTAASATPPVASGVSYTPTSADTSTDVQSAIAEGPRGLIATVNGSAGVALTAGGGLQWITAATSPLTLTVGRRYRIAWCFRAVGRTDASATMYNANISLYNDVGNVNTNMVDHWHYFGGQWGTVAGFVIVPGDGVLRSYRMGMIPTVGVTFYPSWFTIEDMGV